MDLILDTCDRLGEKCSDRQAMIDGTLAGRGGAGYLTPRSAAGTPARGAPLPG